MEQHNNTSNSFDLNQALQEFWPKQRSKIHQISASCLRELNRHGELPLARIKKIVKIDDDVKTQMISAEATMLLAKASEMIIEELSLRAWYHTQENRRKTIQKFDIAMAVSRNEMFDFLIDIVPREDILRSKLNNNPENDGFIVMQQDEYPKTESPQVQYIVQYNGNGMPENSTLANSLMQLENGQIIQATQIGPSIPLSGQPGQPIQFMTLPNGEQIQIMPVNSDS